MGTTSAMAQKTTYGWPLLTVLAQSKFFGGKQDPWKMRTILEQKIIFEENSQCKILVSEQMSFMWKRNRPPPALIGFFIGKLP